MKNGAIYFKYSVYLAALIAILIIFFWWRGCGNGSTKTPKSDTISIKRDTVWIDKADSIVYIPVPYKVEVPKPYAVHDSLIEYSIAPVDSLAILKDYFSKKYYRDTLRNEYGYIVLSDTIYKNAIAGRSAKANLKIPSVKETVTLREKKRAILYATFEAMGGQQDFLFATGAGLSLKAKDDKIYGLKAYLTKQGDPMFGVQFLLPIKLRKQ